MSALADLPKISDSGISAYVLETSDAGMMIEICVGNGVYLFEIFDREGECTFFSVDYQEARWHYELFMRKNEVNTE